VGGEPPRRHRRRHRPVPDVPRDGLPRHGALARVRRPYLLDRARHEDVLPGRPGWLLRVPQRSLERRADGQPRTRRVQPQSPHASSTR
jgi:hypothetical protein